MGSGIGFSPDIRGLPGFSITLTEVPLGPGTLATTSLNLFARVEPWVVGTIRVAVAPLSLNQVALSVFSTCFLWAFDL